MKENTSLPEWGGAGSWEVLSLSMKSSLPFPLNSRKKPQKGEHLSPRLLKKERGKRLSRRRVTLGVLTELEEEEKGPFTFGPANQKIQGGKNKGARVHSRRTHRPLEHRSLGKKKKLEKISKRGS